MRKLLILAVSALVLAPGTSGSAEERRAPEGCQAFNPVQPSCTYTVTHTSATPVTGVAGVGDWVVKVKRGRQKLTFSSPNYGEPTAMEIAFKDGDKVTATALSPGSGLTVGHVDP